MQGSTVCSYCDTSEKPATAHCLDCKESMCETCRLSHTKIKALQDHQVVPIEDVESGKIKMSEKKYCTKHEGEPNKFYCETCEKLVCRDCIVMKQCCRDHDYVTLQEAAAKQADNVKKALEMCKKTEAKIHDKIKEIEKVEANLRKLLTKVQNVQEVGRQVSESASYFEIVSKYDAIKQVLEKVESHGITSWTETTLSQPKKLSKVDNHVPTEKNTLQGLQSLSVSHTVNSGSQQHWKQ